MKENRDDKMEIWAYLAFWLCVVLGMVLTYCG